MYYFRSIMQTFARIKYKNLKNIVFCSILISFIFENSYSILKVIILNIEISLQKAIMIIDELAQKDYQFIYIFYLKFSLIGINSNIIYHVVQSVDQLSAFNEKLLAVTPIQANRMPYIMANLGLGTDCFRLPQVIGSIYVSF